MLAGCDRPKLTRSNKVYKFGDSRQFASTGSVILVGVSPLNDDPANLRRRSISIKTDIVQADIPLLLSRASLQLMSVMLDFCTNRLKFGNSSHIPLSVRPGGHLTFDFSPSKPNDLRDNKISKTVFAASSDSEEISADTNSKIADGRLFWKLHFHLGHIDVAGIKRLCDLAGFSIDEIRAREWLQTCKCGRGDRQPQLPIIGKHLGSEPGEKAMMDILYPTLEEVRKSPAMIMVCPMTRYLACRFVSDLRPSTLLSIFSRYGLLCSHIQN